MRLLNQNIKLIPNADDTQLSLVNSQTGQELGRIYSNEPMTIWLNKGYFMSKEEYDEYCKESLNKELGTVSVE